MAKKLVDLVTALESLKLIPDECVAEAAPLINEAIRKMGKPDGPLRSGNAVKCSVVARGSKLFIVGVFPSAGVRKAWVTIIQKIAARLIQEHLKR